MKRQHMKPPKYTLEWDTRHRKYTLYIVRVFSKASQVKMRRWLERRPEIWVIYRRGSLCIIDRPNNKQLSDQLDAYLVKLMKYIPKGRDSADVTVMGAKPVHYVDIEHGFDGEDAPLCTPRPREWPETHDAYEILNRRH